MVRRPSSTTRPSGWLANARADFAGCKIALSKQTSEQSPLILASGPWIDFREFIFLGEVDFTESGLLGLTFFEGAKFEGPAWFRNLETRDFSDRVGNASGSGPHPLHAVDEDPGAPHVLTPADLPHLLSLPEPRPLEDEAPILPACRRMLHPPAARGGDDVQRPTGPRVEVDEANLVTNDRKNRRGERDRDWSSPSSSDEAGGDRSRQTGGDEQSVLHQSVFPRIVDLLLRTGQILSPTSTMFRCPAARQIAKQASVPSTQLSLKITAPEQRLGDDPRGLEGLRSRLPRRGGS
jgi:hypothetical protein